MLNSISHEVPNLHPRLYALLTSRSLLPGQHPHLYNQTQYLQILHVFLNVTSHVTLESRTSHPYTHVICSSQQQHKDVPEQNYPMPKHNSLRFQMPTPCDASRVPRRSSRWSRRARDSRLRQPQLANRSIKAEFGIGIAIQSSGSEMIALHCTAFV